MSILSDICILPIIKALGLFSKVTPLRLPIKNPLLCLENRNIGQTIYAVCLSKKILIEGEKDFYVSEFVPYANKPLDVRLKYKQSSAKRKTQVTLSTKVSSLELTTF